MIGLLALGACGTDTVDSAGPEATASSDHEASEATGALPECAEVWRTGETLSDDYAGCQRDGETVRGDRLACSSGQVFYTFTDSHYAVVGGLVREVQGDIDSDPAYRKAVRSCRA